MPPLASAKSVTITRVETVFVIGSRTGKAVTVTQPLQQITILASLAAKW